MERERGRDGELAELIDRLPYGAFLIDDRLRVLHLNPAAQAIFGVGDGRQNAETLLPSLTSREEGTRESTGLRADGSSFPARATVVAGDPTLVVIEDLGPARQVEKILDDSRRLATMGSFLTGVAHDFNNILTAIISFSTLARRDLPRDHSVGGDLGEIIRLSQRAATLVRQILALCRRQTLSPRVFNVAETVANIEGFLRRVVGVHIQIETALAAPVALIRADPAQVEQAIVGLCALARAALPNGGRLSISAADVTFDEAFAEANSWARPGSYVKITVANTGSGFSERATVRDFELSPGTPLSLTVIAQLVGAQGGLLHTRVLPDQGSAADVYLPAGREEVEAAVVTGNETILVADDDAAVRQLATRVLLAAGYRVLPAADGSEAMRIFLAHRESIRLAILDAVMPGLDGPELERAFLAQASVPVLIMTGYGSTRDNVLAKPFDPEELLRRVRATLDRA